MTPMDQNHQITKGDLKESVEALVGANFMAYGFGPHKQLIDKIYKIIKKIESKIQEDKQLQLLYENPKGRVLELFQANGFELPLYNTERVGGEDHLPLFRCTLTGKFFEKELKTQSDLANNKNILYSNQNLSIARWSAGGRHWNGRISNFSVYNRVLTASEISQNFNALRSRFGL